MSVLISEFEVIAEPPVQRAEKDDGGGDRRDRAAERLQPQDLARLIETLARQTLRAWAH